MGRHSCFDIRFHPGCFLLTYVDTFGAQDQHRLNLT